MTYAYGVVRKPQSEIREAIRGKDGGMAIDVNTSCALHCITNGETLRV